MVTESKLDEAKVETALQNLLQSISTAIASNRNIENDEDISEDNADLQTVYSNLLHLSRLAYEVLHEFGTMIELSSISEPKLSSNEEGIVEDSFSESTRERWRNVGRSIWMMIRSHPAVFSDAKQHRNLSSRAISGGYTRAIAARLILLNGFLTKDSDLVALKMNSEDESSSVLSMDELEFGLKCFSRAGRCLLSNENDSDSNTSKLSFVTLHLASICWKAMKVEISKSPTDSFERERIENAFEEAFDAMAILPDAAVFVYSCTTTTASKVKLGDADHIVELLEDLNRLVMSDDFMSLSKKQRFLPVLARTAYKQGNRLAKNGSYSKSRECLRISLSATDVSLAAIRAESGESTSDSVKTQEQELLVISKECFYVLAHTCQATGKYMEAHKCLDQIEVYVDDQKKRDDELYSKVMEHLSVSVSDDTAGLPIVSGPRALDKQDIRSRAQAAHARSKITQYRERANLAFSRTMLLHHQCDSHEGAESRDVYNGIEERLDHEISRLVDLSAKFLGNNDPIATEADTSIFELALKACRFTRVRRLTQNIMRTQDDKGNVASSANPYDLMFLKHDKKRGKFLVVAIDHLNAVVSTCHEVRTRTFAEFGENIDNADNSILMDSVGVRSLDLVAIQVAENVMSSLESIWNEKYLNAGKSDSTSILPVNVIEGVPSITLMSLAEQAKIQYARALALYRTLPSSHGLTAQYADILLKTLKIISQYDEGTNQHDDPTVIQMMAEVIGIKAYALSSSGSFVSGLNSARLAWKSACEATSSPILNKTVTGKEIDNSCKVHNLVVLFYCSIRQDLASRIHHDGSVMNEDISVPGDVLVELDDALSELNVQDRLSIFPALCQSCLKGVGETSNNDAEQNFVDDNQNSSRQILLGVQQRWVSLLADVLSKNETVAFPPCEKNHQIGLFPLLRAYLVTFEELFHPLKDDEASLDYKYANPEQLDHTLASIICVIKRLRDDTSISKASGTSSEDEGKSSLIWENEHVQISIGTQQDCVWIAEQSWNIACQLMNLPSNTSYSKEQSSKMIASHLFVKAHDFALLSEEENGMYLTRSYIEGDLPISDPYNQENPSDQPLLSFASKSSKTSCELSSEFSAHCLLLSLANAVDAMYDDKIDQYNNRKTLIQRIRQCRDEFICNTSMDEQSSKYGGETDGVLSWLALRILIEIGDDFHCVQCLGSGNIMNVITKGNTSSENINEDSATSVASHLYLCAKRAQAKKMLLTTKLLLRQIALYLNQNGRNQLNIPYEGLSRDVSKGTSENITLSLGDIQRKLVQLASSINETVDIFENISKASIQVYNKDCLNWFTIEAYNRGINLLYLGEIGSAERLLAVALNLLPSCGKEVECHSSEMRLAYHRAVERKNGNIASLLVSPRSVSGSDSLDLFCRM